MLLCMLRRETDCKRANTDTSERSLCEGLYDRVNTLFMTQGTQLGERCGQETPAVRPSNVRGWRPRREADPEAPCQHAITSRYGHMACLGSAHLLARLETYAWLRMGCRGQSGGPHLQFVWHALSQGLPDEGCAAGDVFYEVRKARGEGTVD